MKKFGALFLLFGLSSSLFLTWGCALRKSHKVKIKPEETPAAVDTTKPKSEEPTIVFEEVPPAETKPEVTQPSEEKPAQVYGYRVQIMAALKEENANRMAEEARSKLDKPVYIEYIPPYYKVRVGDFLSREEAERYRDKLKALGYYDAFIVETLINTH